MKYATFCYDTVEVENGFSIAWRIVRGRKIYLKRGLKYFIGKATLDHDFWSAW